MPEELHVDVEESAAQTPTPLTASESSTTPTLDSLLSPTDPDAHFSIRESIASSDVTDDARFSTVSLSARQSLDSTHASVISDASSNALQDDRRNTFSASSLESTAETLPVLQDGRGHKKTASTSTILSASNVQFLSEGDPASRRSSMEAQQKLQEELSRKSNDLQEESEDAVESSIDWDFWGDVVSDYQKFASEHPEQLAKAIERGIPKTLRGMIWQLMSASKDPELESTYIRLLKEASPHEKAITRDLGRTFPHHAFFTDGRGIGQENLFNVLKAYSLYDAQVGYCQGLPFVAAILLLHMPDEEAFCLLVRLMHSYDLRGHFLPDMPKLQLRLFQFERLVEELAPVIHIHFLRQGIKSNMYCSQWFLTMFSYRFPLDIVVRIYDNCLASGIEAMFTFSLVLLLKNEETLLSLKFDQLLAFLNTRVFEVYQLEPSTPASAEGETPTDAIYNVDEFVQDAVSLKITPFMLDSYAQEYDEIVRTREAHALEMDVLRNSNRSLSNQVKNLEASLAQLNTEHCEVLNELVRARLRHEDIESELVRYKLLYAEAMHKSEDAMSSHRISAVLLSKRGSSNTGG
ncbi:rab-GTPase-TBC domain-containing protein [Amylocystis lapponica]|nr:rab-GTPase-TBC domain-containing protein [Amylocystis lapponica]